MRLSRYALVAIPLFVVVLCQTALAETWAHNDGEVGASASSSTSVVVSTTLPAPLVCDWGTSPFYGFTDRAEVDDLVLLHVDGRYWKLSLTTGEIWLRTFYVCRRDGVVESSVLGWRRVVGPNPEVIAEGLYDRVVRQVPAPVADLSPTSRGVVNLGMWLAVESAGPVSVTAVAGGVWATTTARLVSTTFDMGDGSVVRCDGAGDPIPAWAVSSVAPSQVCGHTYASTNRGEPFSVVITSSWRVSWSGSGGRGGDLGVLDRVSVLEYPVREIQTVGR